MTRVAVIGVGSMGRNHVRVYTEMPEAELVAVVDANPEAVEQVGRLYRVPGYTDFHEMFERERPEAVSVAVPTEMHFAVAMQAIEAGCHVLVEKPIAASVEDAQRLIDAAGRAGLVLMVGHIERFNPAIIELKRRLDAGELGPVFQIHARRLGPYPARIRDVGVVMDLAPHDIDIMRYLLGRDVAQIYAKTKSQVNKNQDDMFIGLVEFQDSTLGLLEINWLTPTKIRELYVTGVRGMFRVNYVTQDLFFYENADVNGNGWQALSLFRGVSEGTFNRFAIRKKEPLRAELETFIACIQGKCANPMDGNEARIALELTLAMLDSARSGQIKGVLTP